MLDLIYPGRKEHGWMPLIWLMYLVFFFIDPYFNHRGPLIWTATIVVGIAFVLLYLRSFSAGGQTAIISTLTMVAMGILCMPWNSGAVGFFIYAAAAVAWVDQSRKMWLWLTLIIGILLGENWLLHRPLVFGVMMSFFALTTGAANFYFAQKKCAAKKLQLAQDEVEHLAKVAERERIARDLHDLLGHTLSLITLKAELARKLVDRDPQRAKQEMLDVEHTSRAALADVREAISGYRGEGLAAELIRARKTLETAGITVDSEFDGTAAHSGAGDRARSCPARGRHQRCAACPGAAMQRSTATRNNLCTLEIATMAAAPTVLKATDCAACASVWSPLAARCNASPGRNPPCYSFATRPRCLHSAKLRA